MSNKINIKTIQERLGLPVTGAFIEGELKEPAVERDKRAVFWDESQYGPICDKLISHIKARRSSTAVAAKPEPKAKVEPGAAAEGFNFGNTSSGSENGFDFGTQGVESSFSFGEPAAAAEEGGFDFGK